MGDGAVEGGSLEVGLLRGSDRWISVWRSGLETCSKDRGVLGGSFAELWEMESLGIGERDGVEGYICALDREVEGRRI